MHEYLTQVFQLTERQASKLEQWIEQNDQEAIENGASTVGGVPYGGAIEARFTFHFTPSGIGDFVSVTDDLTNKRIDLTEYELM